MIKLITPKNGAVLSAMTPGQKKFVRLFNGGELDGALFPPEGKGAYDWLPPKRGAGRDLAAPPFVVFRWESDEAAAAMFFEISADPDFREPAPVSVLGIREDGERENSYFAVVTNLQGGARYFWRISDGETSSEPFSFTTERGEVRFVWVEGLSNVRDLGGKPTEDGRYIKEGMIFRGPALDAIIDPPYEMSERGKKTVVRELGIKTEIDLREEAREIIRQCVLSDDIEYDLIPLESYVEVFLDYNEVSFRQIFNILADESKYPVYFHCQIGSDRTGTLAMFVLAALGASDKAIDFDYSVNSMTITEKRSFTGSPEVKAFLSELDKRYPGGTYADKMRRHLIKAGVKPETIEKVREIITEEKK